MRNLDQIFQQYAELDFSEFKRQIKARFELHFKPQAYPPEMAEKAKAIAWCIYQSGVLDSLDIACDLAEKSFQKMQGLN